MKRNIRMIAAGCLAVVFLTACGVPATTLPPVDDTPVAAASSTATVAVVPTDTSIPSTATAETAPGADSTVSFAADILPVLQSRCANCHGDRRKEEGLYLITYDGVMAGSEHGAVVVPGDAASSKLATLVADGKMPKLGPKLTPAQVQLIVDWINAGAQNN